MDRDWMRQQLEAFDDLALRYENSSRPGDFMGDPKLYELLHRAEPTVKQILRLLDPHLAEKINLDQMAGESMARNEVHRGLGILADKDQWAIRLAPDAPTLPADQFHPWVWEPAAPLWAAEARQGLTDLDCPAFRDRGESPRPGLALSDDRRSGA